MNWRAWFYIPSSWASTLEVEGDTWPLNKDETEYNFIEHKGDEQYKKEVSNQEYVEKLEGWCGVFTRDQGGEGNNKYG